MTRLLFEFTGGTYHATPWGHHVNEGLVEWPPSPWRIIRALLATGYTKLGWQEVPQEMRRLVEALAECEPTYHLPPATTGHTRHYMPVRGLKKGLPKTSLVIDAFVRPSDRLLVDWPLELDALQRNLLEDLLTRLGYLGRAESRVRARLAVDSDTSRGLVVSRQRREPDDEPVRLLAPVSSQSYDAWRKSFPEAPSDLIAALHMDTKTLQKEKWSAPPGTRELVYWRPAKALVHVFALGRADSVGADFNDTALFALSTDKKRDVLPLMERALPTMALFRRALLSRIGDEQKLGACPELTGKDREGRPLQCEHQHAHFIPLSLDHQNPKRIDHVLVFAPMGFGPLAGSALRRLRRTWTKGLGDVAVTLIGLGKLGEFRRLSGALIPELGTSRVWVSRTPFVPPRFLKPRGHNSLEGQVREELRVREFPELLAPPVVARPHEEAPGSKQAVWFRRFVRTRQGNGGLPPAGVFHLTLKFHVPVTGPLCLGWGAHFGLGLFVPVEEDGGR
ncbi:MAG: type I-U CRISPR-associated protein Csb2 [Bryobacteraceae bacterium]|nr:type I-U CRISPR-associated protein Csb2 [Bryobacteraceae bacterium]MDW8380194.1 type I-U CRISPR-associated protein Csb2 [Bryobacterales bacterium]